MDIAHPPAPVGIGRHPIVATLTQFPVVCFTLTLLTDLAFWQTSYLMWQHFSEWLLLAGLLVGGLALIAGLFGVLFRRKDRARRPAWPYAIGGLIVLGLALLNSLVHAGDGWTAVVPYGLLLSAVTVLVMALTGWIGRSTALRHAKKVSSYA